jgi:hypothetical protein
MINITKQGNNVIVTSDNPNSFNISNGELSVPLNTIYYVLDDESDFIQFNSTEEGNILFNGTIGQIQVNGNIVTRDNILMELDNVFNSAAIAGEGGTAGVLSINGYDGYINLKSINGQSLIGSGDISVEADLDNYYTKEESDDHYDYDKRYWNSFQYTNDADNWISLRNGKSLIGGGVIYFKTINGEKTVGMGDISFKTINGESLIGSGDITIEGGSSVEETDPIFTKWKNADDVIVGNGAKYDIDGASEEDIQPSIMIGKGASVWASGIAIGENAYSESGAVTIGKNITSYGIVSIGSDNEGGGIAIGKNNKGSGIAIGENNSGNGIIIGTDVTENYGGIAIGDNISNPTDSGIAIGMNAKISTKNPEDTENGYGIAIGCASIAYDKNDVAIGKSVETDATYKTNINNIIKGDVNKYAFVLNEYGNYVRIPTEWTGTQSQYDALGTYYDNITYNIIED